MNDISEELFNFLSSFRRATIMNIMLAALDEMEGYNGQSKTSAIMRALDAEEVETENGMAWKYPPRKQILETFS